MSRSALDLDLDLDAFSGPFDLLLALVLRSELELVEVPVLEIVLAYLGRLEQEDAIDLEAVSEFVVLVAALCELKSRLLVDADDDELEEVDADDAAAELAARLAEYQRFKHAAAELAERKRAAGLRVFRAGRAPLAPPRPAAELVEEQPARLAEALLVLLEPPAALGDVVIRGRTVPVRPYVDRFRRLLRTRASFTFDEEVRGLSLAEHAAAFVALLELVKREEVHVRQAALFAEIGVTRTAVTGLVLRATVEDVVAGEREAVA